MIGVEVKSWAAWSPGREDREAWDRWCAEPTELATGGRPDVGFLPPLLRRRCSTLARAMLAAAFAACSPDELSRVATVFASRHGNLNDSIELLYRLARREPLSPTRFSHTVHNAQAGLFSIAAGNRRGSSSIAAREETFECGWLEALTFLERDPGRPVLLVVGDVPLHETFAPLVREPRGSYAVAFLLAIGHGPAAISVRTQSASSDGRQTRWPVALEFLRWQLSDASRIELGSGRRRWIFERRGTQAISA